MMRLSGGITKPRAKTRGATSNIKFGRCKIDFSTVDVRAKLASAVASIKNIGSLLNYSRRTLEGRRARAHEYGQNGADRGQCSTCLDVTVTRVTHGIRGYSFALLLDHTGYVSVCGKTDCIKQLEAICSTSLDGPEKDSALVSVRY